MNLSFSGQKTARFTVLPLGMGLATSPAPPMRMLLLTAMFVASPILDPRSPGLFLAFGVVLMLAARSLSRQTAP
jgi:hypothetical protein